MGLWTLFAGKVSDLAHIFNFFRRVASIKYFSPRYFEPDIIVEPKYFGISVGDSLVVVENATSVPLFDKYPVYKYIDIPLHLPKGNYVRMDIDEDTYDIILTVTDRTTRVFKIKPYHFTTEKILENYDKKVEELEKSKYKEYIRVGMWDANNIHKEFKDGENVYVLIGRKRVFFVTEYRGGFKDYSFYVGEQFRWSELPEKPVLAYVFYGKAFYFTRVIELNEDYEIEVFSDGDIDVKPIHIILKTEPVDAKAIIPSDEPSMSDYERVLEYLRKEYPDEFVKKEKKEIKKEEIPIHMPPHLPLTLDDIYARSIYRVL